MLGVVNEVTPVPPARGLPPLAALYQSIVSPVPTVAVSVTVPVPHRVKGPAPATGAAGAAVTVATIAVLVAETQPPDVARASA